MRSKLRAELERVARKRAAAEAVAARREFEKANQVTTASWHTPPPEEVTEAQVSAAVARLAEADACGGVVATMSLAALTQAEEELAEGLEQQAAGSDDVKCKESGANQAVQAAAVAAELTRLGGELRRRCDTLHAPRALALSELRAAAASGDFDELHDALYSAHEAGLQVRASQKECFYVSTGLLAIYLLISSSLLALTAGRLRHRRHRAGRPLDDA